MTTRDDEGKEGNSDVKVMGYSQSAAKGDNARSVRLAGADKDGASRAFGHWPAHVRHGSPLARFSAVQTARVFTLVLPTAPFCTVHVQAHHPREGVLACNPKVALDGLLQVF